MTPKKSLDPLPFWLLISLAELACLLNIAWPTPSLTPTFRLTWWRWRRTKRMAAIRSRYRDQPDLLRWLASLFQLRL